MFKLFYVYILASRSRVLYVGMTSDLGNRLAVHRSKAVATGFTARYNVTKLVYTEEYTDSNQAIDRETQLKKWRRDKKVRLIESHNPEWEDLAPERTSNAPILRS